MEDIKEKLENLLKRYKELEAEVESQDKTIDKLVEEQEEREKYTHSLEEENTLLKHRLKTANEFIESRQEVLIPENYEDLKYILNECDLESAW